MRSVPAKEPKIQKLEMKDMTNDNFVKVGENDGNIPITLGDADIKKDDGETMEL